MDKKKMVIIGLIAAAGIGLYFWSKSKKAQPATAGGSTSTSEAATSTTPTLPKPELATTPASYDETLITSWIGKMQANKEWFDAIKQKASEAGRSIEEQLRMDAIFMIEKK